MSDENFEERLALLARVTKQIELAQNALGVALPESISSAAREHMYRFPMRDDQALDLVGLLGRAVQFGRE
ncbi:MAG: hypothetical protein CVV05_00255 [Gammaproteobacteria bacterium HGW-Gammaproteobacteria-1]|jgi:hypothetical protein|nr:MAG: hypothetical protein CVV05_00255 [Gammaproteobacteria bacterium HGW-Gammaproteobacteria-1]